MSGKSGAMPRYIEKLNAIGGLSGTDITNITDVSKATVSRWRAGTVKLQPSMHLVLSDLHYIVGGCRNITPPMKSEHGYMRAILSLKGRELSI